MDQVFSRPIRRLASQGNGYILARSTKMAAFSIKPLGGDVSVKFYDGAGGQILWEAEADNGAGSHFESFADYPLLFKNGIYVSISDDSPDAGGSLHVAVIEPMSSGT